MVKNWFLVALVLALVAGPLASFSEAGIRKHGGLRHRGCCEAEAVAVAKVEVADEGCEHRHFRIFHRCHRCR